MKLLRTIRLDPQRNKVPLCNLFLDIVQRLEANLLMRNYAGFLSGDGESGPRIRSGRSQPRITS